MVHICAAFPAGTVFEVQFGLIEWLLLRILLELPQCWSLPSCQVIDYQLENSILPIPKVRVLKPINTSATFHTKRKINKASKLPMQLQPLLPTNSQRAEIPISPAGHVPSASSFPSLLHRFLSMAPVGGNHPQVMHLRWFRAQKSAIKLQRSGDILLWWRKMGFQDGFAIEVVIWYTPEN